MASRKRQLENYTRRWGPMKYVKYESEFLDINGNTMEIPDPDRKHQREVREKALEEGEAKGLKPSEISWTPPVLEVDFAGIICWFANSIGMWDTDADGKPAAQKPEEVGNALKVIRAFQSPNNGFVGIEEKALEWLKTQLSDMGPKAFPGVTSAMLLERLADTREGSEPSSEEAAND